MIIITFIIFVAIFCFTLVNAEDSREFLAAGDAKLFKSDGKIIKYDIPGSHSNSTAPGSYGWYEYKQCDSRWAYQELGTCSSQTICSAGCAMSSVAMILKTKGCNYDPGTLDSWLTKNGGYANGCNIYWAKPDALGCTHFQSIQKASESEICNGLSLGHGIVANVNGGAHWVLLTACAGNGVYYVNDPGYSKTTYSHSEILQEAVYH